MHSFKRVRKQRLLSRARGDAGAGKLMDGEISGVLSLLRTITPSMSTLLRTTVPSTAMQESTSKRAAETGRGACGHESSNMIVGTQFCAMKSIQGYWCMPATGFNIGSRLFSVRTNGQHGYLHKLVGVVVPQIRHQTAVNQTNRGFEPQSGLWAIRKSGAMI